MRGKEREERVRSMRGRGGTTCKCCKCGFTCHICNIDTSIQIAHVHFPHLVLSEVRVHVVVPLLSWLVGNAVTNGEKLGESYHMTVD